MTTDNRSAVEALFNQAAAEVAPSSTVPALQNMLDRSRDFDSRKTDFKVATGKRDNVPENMGVVFVDTEGKLRAGRTALDADAYNLAPRGWSQMCERLGEALFGKGSVPRAAYEAAATHKNANIRAAGANMINTLIAEGQPNQWLIRTYETTARAVLSSKYAPLDNTEVLQTMTNILNAQFEQKHLTPDKVSLTRGSIVTPDQLYLQVLMKGVDPRDSDLPDPHQWEGTDSNGNPIAPYSLGVSVRNGETGGDKVEVAGIIQRGSCLNSIRTKTLVSLTHVGHSTDLLYQMTGAIATALRTSAQTLQRLMSARYIAIPNFGSAVDDLCEAFDWNTDVRNNLITGSEGKHSLYGLVNGISYHAAHADMNIDDRAAFEGAAGSVLDAPQNVLRVADHAWLNEVIAASNRVEVR